jgi:MATE family multidrug resistance protein
MNVTGFSLVLGLLGALDTLCGQAWGARNYRALGVTLQKAVVTTLATSLAVCLLWAHMEWLMLAVGQQPRIAAGAARFLLLATPALMFAGMFECIKRYLMAQASVMLWWAGWVGGWQGLPDGGRGGLPLRLCPTQPLWP